MAVSLHMGHNSPNVIDLLLHGSRLWLSPMSPAAFAASEYHTLQSDSDICSKLVHKLPLNKTQNIMTSSLPRILLDD